MALIDVSERSTAPDVRQRASATAARAGPVLGLGACVLLLALTPVIYGLVAFHAIDQRLFAAPVLEHVALNVLANGVVAVSALRLAGRFDEKLSGVFWRVLMAHGVLAFFTLVSRHYYSIPMLLSGAALSVVLGAGVAFFRQKAVRPRVGLLGPAHWITDDPWIRCDPLTDPAAPLSPYQFILITFDGPVPPEWTATLSRALLAGKRVRHVAEYVEDARGVTAIEHFDVDHLTGVGSAGYRLGKRGLDLLFVLGALPVAIPMMAVAALAIKLTVGGPALFIQSRVGQAGRAFAMLKLRTMRDAPGEAGIATARDDDRITPIGRWLRRFRIDELPQLWNILVGDMSLIGPRPEQPALAQQYAAQTPAFTYRQLVRPGITGWAQVRAPYAANLTETRVKLGYDLFYLKHLSLGLDAQIMIRTVWTLLGGGGVR